MHIAAAALCYFAIVFGVGFLLGPFRVTLLEPRLGETVATLCEAPFLLTAIVLAGRWLPHRFKLTTTPSRVAMGLGALVLQQAADIVIGRLLREISFTDYLAHFSTPAGLIYAALLVAFTIVPVGANRG